MYASLKIILKILKSGDELGMKNKEQIIKIHGLRVAEIERRDIQRDRYDEDEGIREEEEKKMRV